MARRTRADPLPPLPGPPEGMMTRRAVLVGAATTAFSAASFLGARPRVVSPEDYGARADGHGDDTAALAAAARAAAGGVLTLTAGGTYLTQGTELPPRTALRGQGAVLRASPRATGSVLTVTDGCEVAGVEIDGNRGAGARATCLTARHGAGLTIWGVYLHDAGGAGLTLDHVTRYTLRDVRVRAVSGQGIEAVFSNHGRISACSVDTALHGIQLWGGDAADTSATTWIESAEITDCLVRNVSGGIWAARGRDLVVSRNIVHACSDVGIDFEGCSRCTASDNTVAGAAEAALAVFYASSDCVFRRNTVIQGVGMGPGFKPFGTGVSRRITVQDNVFVVADGPACDHDRTVLADSSVQCSAEPA